MVHDNPGLVLLERTILHFFADGRLAYRKREFVAKSVEATVARLKKITQEKP